MLPKLQVQAPDFNGIAVFQGAFKEVSLQEYRGKYLLLLFYPMDFSFICPSELGAFSDRIQEFRAKGCEILACSTDSQYAHYAWSNTPKKNAGVGEIAFPLLSDKSLKISKDYCVLNEEDGVSYRGMFLIDQKLNLRHITLNNAMMPRSVDESLRLLHDCQFIDDHGEVSPINWKPIGKHINTDAKKAAEISISVN